MLAGVTAYCRNGYATPEDVAAVECLLASFGTTVELEESQLDAASAIGGSSPAYVYMFIEALADAGVAKGLSARRPSRLLRRRFWVLRSWCWNRASILAS